MLPTPPASIDYSGNASTSLRNIYDNDTLGDCTIASKAHQQGIWTGNADGGTPVVWADSDVIAMYSAISGYQPGNPSTDTGCDPTDVLNYCCTTGFPDGSKAVGWVEVDATNIALLQTTVFTFESADICVELPDAWISPFPSADGYVWDVTSAGPDPNNGHCFCAIGYNSLGLQVDSWALYGTITYAALAAYCIPSQGGAVYVLLSQEMIAAGQVNSPNGFDWATLQADLQAVAMTIPSPAPC